MSDVIAELKTARGLAMVFLAAVVAASFVMVVVTARGETPVTQVSAEDFSQLSLDSGVAVTQQLALDLCGIADTEVRCLSEITKVPGSVGPSGDVSVFVPSGGSSFLTPADLQEAYHIPEGNSGATIAVVSAYGYDAAQIASDLEAYRDQYGLAACDGCLTILNQNGEADPLPDVASLSQEVRDGWAMETALDLDMVSATCPSCSIELYLADSARTDDMAAAVQAASQSATYVSMSWGAANVDATAVADFDIAFNTDGVLYFASSGDDGYGDVEYPAVSSRVIGVGGTALYQDLSTPRLWREQAWTGVPNTSKKGGPGSGCSSAITKPAWQEGVVDDALCSGAALADISAVASHDSPVVVRFAGNWYGAFGTSVAAPVVAGIYAAAGVTGATSNALTYMYEKPDKFHDIVAGGRSVCDPAALALCVAADGWDGPTGVGTPDGTLSFDPDAVPVSDGSGGEGSELAEPTITVSGSGAGDMTPNGGTVVATLSPGDPLDLSIEDFGDYDDVQFNISLAFEDGDGEQLGSYAVPPCIVARDSLPGGLDLSGCVLSGAVDAFGDYTFSLKQDADGNLVLTVTVTPPPGTSTTPTSSSGPSTTTTSTTESTASAPTTPTSSTTSGPAPTSSTDPGSTTAPASTTTSSSSTSSTSTTPPAASTTATSPTASPTPTTSTSPTTSPVPPDTSGTPAPTTTPSATTSSPPPPGTTSAPTTPTTTPSSPATTTTSAAAAASIPAPPPPASSSLASPPAPHRKAYVVDVTIKVVLAGLVGTGPNGGTTSIDPSATILRDIVTPGRDVTQADAINVLSQLPAVEGLTPAYTPQAVAFIRLAKLVVSLLPFDVG